MRTFNVVHPGLDVSLPNWLVVRLKANLGLSLKEVLSECTEPLRLSAASESPGMTSGHATALR